MNKNYSLRNKKTKIEFKEFYIDTKDIPGYEQFKKVIEEEYEFNNQFYKHDTTVPEFYENAKKILSQKQIRCLRISDFNTTGLTGDNWENLTKNAGVSDKPEGSGGSKGKGKFASFICSDLYTVFYSTYTIENERYSCGVARLSGYAIDETTNTLGEGYYEKDRKRIEACMDLDPQFNRAEYGTDIYIIGLKERFKDWEEKLIGSILDYFIFAIMKGELEVTVNEYNINQKTVNVLIKDEKISKYVHEVTSHYYDVLIEQCEEEKSKIEPIYGTIFEENDLELRIKNGKNYNNKVAAVRSTGMKIQDLMRLPSYGNYTGILYLKGEEVNEYFRKLENANHNKWSQDRSKNPEEAKRKIKELKDFVINSIKEKLLTEQLEELDAEGMGEFLPDEDEFVENEANESHKEIEHIEIKPVDFTKRKKEEEEIKEELATIQEEEEIEEDDLNPEDEPWENEPEEPEDEPEDETTEEVADEPEEESDTFSSIHHKIAPTKIRRLATEKGYIFILAMPNDYEKVKIALKISGEEGNEKLNIQKAKVESKKLIKSRLNTQVKENEIVIENMKKHEDYLLKVETEETENWAVEVSVYVDK